jgi:hypothetical protein
LGIEIEVRIKVINVGPYKNLGVTAFMPFGFRAQCIM